MAFGGSREVSKGGSAVLLTKVVDTSKSAFSSRPEGPLTPARYYKHRSKGCSKEQGPEERQELSEGARRLIEAVAPPRAYLAHRQELDGQQNRASPRAQRAEAACDEDLESEMEIFTTCISGSRPEAFKTPTPLRSTPRPREAPGQHSHRGSAQALPQASAQGSLPAKVPSLVPEAGGGRGGSVRQSAGGSPGEGGVHSPRSPQDSFVASGVVSPRQSQSRYGATPRTGEKRGVLPQAGVETISYGYGFPAVVKEIPPCAMAMPHTDMPDLPPDQRFSSTYNVNFLDTTDTVRTKGPVTAVGHPVRYAPAEGRFDRDQVFGNQRQGGWCVRRNG